MFSNITVPTPLASGGVGLYINDSLKYTVIDKVSDEAFQSLWIEIQLPQKSNISCGIIYRQHNSPKRFQEYFDDKLEKLITSNKSIYIMGDFNINLLHVETSCYAQDLILLSLQSFSFIPTIDKPTRVYNTSATLIDNNKQSWCWNYQWEYYLWHKWSLFTILYFTQFYSGAKTRKAKTQRLFWLFQEQVQLWTLWCFGKPN